MAGTAYTSVNFVLSKPFARTSRWGFFHQSTLVAGYDEAEVEDDVALQGLVTFEPRDGFRLTAGAFFASGPGASPTVGMQYVRPGARWFVLVSPRVNVERDPSYSIFSILRYTRGREADARLFLSLQALNTFEKAGHIKSYQWLRAGVDVRGTQVGLALNLDEDGPRPRIETRAGLFLRRDVF